MTRRNSMLVLVLLFVCLPLLLLLPFRRRLDAILVPTSYREAQRRQLLECKRRERARVIKCIIKTNWDRKSYLSTNHREETKRAERVTRLCYLFLLALVRCDTVDTVIWIKKVRKKGQKAQSLAGRN